MERVRPYSPDDAPTVNDLLVRAFHDDPGYVHTFPDGRTKALQTILPPLLGLRRVSGSVRVFERDGQVVGCLFAIELDFLEGRQKLGDTPITSLIHY